MSLVFAALLPSAPAHAYDNRLTHRWIARQAATLLADAYPGEYDDLLEYVDEIAEGADHEDDFILDGDDDPTTMRVMRHFFRPTDDAGLTMPNHPEAFPNSYEWGALPSDHNEWGWDDGIAAYTRGDIGDAYFIMGHVVHLVSDLTVPAHTHLDIHGPPTGDDYEAYCTSQMIDEHSSMLPVPSAAGGVPVFATTYHAWRATAEASYRRNLYAGDLSDPDAPDGAIVEMFPAIEFSWFADNWKISEPPVGELGAGFLERSSGLYYFKTTEHVAAFDVVDYDPADPALATLAANTTQQPMAALLARDLIPVAIRHSAGVMKLFVDQARAAATDTGTDDPTDSTDDPAAPTGCSTGGNGSATLLLGIALIICISRRKKCLA